MYLVTGATGVIGLPLVETLLAAGAGVKAVTRDPDQAPVPAGATAVAPQAVQHALKGRPSATATWSEDRTRNSPRP